ncbi:hypothetical protein [Clostridium saccharoperbutylacetonicum]|uniref:hypothetical protein n=1 Tax=Clostridium saccharoperbutylacetonicum TaxID=36745 RepID=UPI0039EA72A4
MDCPNCKNNIGKDRTGEVICILALKGECYVKYNTSKISCDKEIVKGGYLRESN